jgi:hypothetical protein
MSAEAFVAGIIFNAPTGALMSWSVRHAQLGVSFLIRELHDGL